MPRVKVKYFNVYYNVSRKHEEYIEFDGRLTLAELLERVCKSYQSKFKELVFDGEDKLKPHVWILINKERERNLRRELKDGEVIVFSLPIVGG
jgi:molybdopterin converting factor small subunit